MYKKLSNNFVNAVALKCTLFLARPLIPDAIQAAGLQVRQHGPGHVGAAAALAEEDVDPLELLVIPALVLPGGRDTVLLRHDRPELGAHLVPALTHLMAIK